MIRKLLLSLFISISIFSIDVFAKEEIEVKGIKTIVSFINKETNDYVEGITFKWCSNPTCANETADGVTYKSEYGPTDINKNTYSHVFESEDHVYESYIVAQFVPLGCEPYIEPVKRVFSAKKPNDVVNLTLYVTPKEGGNCGKDTYNYGEIMSQTVAFVNENNEPVSNVKWTVRGSNYSSVYDEKMAELLGPLYTAHYKSDPCSGEVSSMFTYLYLGKPQLLATNIGFRYKYIHTIEVPEGYQQLECTPYVLDGQPKVYTLKSINSSNSDTTDNNGSTDNDINNSTGTTNNGGSNNNVVGNSQDNNVTTTNFAKFIINGEEIKEKIDVYLKNDRTFVELNTLCKYLDCDYTFNQDEIALTFNVFGTNINSLDNSALTDMQINGLSSNITYVIKHKIGTNKYDTFLKLSNYKKYFSLKSPTFDENNVDVVSEIKDGKVYVPLRFISEALGRYVTYEPEKDGALPVITITSMGEGEFYEKYNIKFSKTMYGKNDVVSDGIDAGNISLKEKNEKLYLYPIHNSNNQVVDTSRSIFFPLINVNENINVDNSKDNYNKDYIYNVNNIFQVEKNSVYNVTNGNNNVIIPFIAIANVDGYPFIRTVYLEG